MLKKVAKIAAKYQAAYTPAVGVKALDMDAARDVARYTAMPDQSAEESPDVFGRFLCQSYSLIRLARA